MGTIAKPELLKRFRSSQGLWCAVAVPIITCSVFLAAPITSSKAVINWYGGYEDGATYYDPPDLESSTAEGWRGANHLLDNVETNTEVVSEPRREGLFAGSISSNPETLNSEGHQKVEVFATTGATLAAEGDDTWYAWSFYFPSSSPQMASGTLVPWKEVRERVRQCDIGGPYVNFANRWIGVASPRCPNDPEASPEWRGFSFPLTTSYTLDVWHDIVLHVHWSIGHSAFIEAWFDGEQVAPKTYMPNLGLDGDTIWPLRVIEGIYREAGDPETGVPTSTIYYDAMRVGTSYEDVASFNPSFETDLRDWQVTADLGFDVETFERSSAWTSVGEYSLRVSGKHDASNTALALGASQMGEDHGTRVAPGHRYEVKVDLHSYDPPQSKGYRLRLDWFQADGSSSASASTTSSLLGTGQTGDLTPTLTVTAPADAAFAQLQVEAISGTVEDLVDFSIDRIRFDTDPWESQTGPDLISNPSFEDGSTGWQSLADEGVSLLSFESSSAWFDDLHTSLHVRGYHEISASGLLAFGAQQPSGTKGMAIQGGQDYFARAVINSNTSPQDGGYRLRISWFKANGEPDGTTQSGLRGQGIGQDTVLPLFFAATAPADAAYASLAIEAVSGAPDETVDFYLDNAMFRRTKRADSADVLYIGTMEPPIPHLSLNPKAPAEVVEANSNAPGTDGWYRTDRTLGGNDQPINMSWKSFSPGAIDGDWSMDVNADHDPTDTEATAGVETASDTTGIPIEGGRSYRLADKVRIVDAPADGIQLSARMLDDDGNPIPSSERQTDWHEGEGEFTQSLIVDAPTDAHYIQISALAKSGEPDDKIVFKLDDVELVPLPASPVAAYSFDEGEGLTAADSAGGHDGTLEGGASWVAEGKYGSAIKFDGASGLVKVADAADLDLNESFTLEAWVHPDSLFNGSTAIGKGGDFGEGVSGYALYAQSPYVPEPAGGVANNGAIAGIASQSTLPSGIWSHLAFTSDGETLRLYVDGELVGTHTAIAAGSTDADLEIGHNSYLESSFGGLIDEVRIYDVPLSEGQIKADHDEPISPHIETERYPATLTGSGLAELQVDRGSIECSRSTLEGTITEAVNHLDLNATYSGCQVIYDGGKSASASMNMKSCHFVLGVQGGPPTYSGTMGVTCENPGDAIEVRVSQLNLKCLNIYPQEDVEGIDLTNSGAGAEREIDLNGELNGVKYELVPSPAGCTKTGKAESRSDGVIRGSTTLHAEDEAEEQVGAYLAGRP